MMKDIEVQEKKAQTSSRRPKTSARRGSQFTEEEDAGRNGRASVVTKFFETLPYGKIESYSHYRVSSWGDVQ